MRKIDRVLAYLNATRDEKLTLGAGTGPLCLHAFIDASYAPHADAKSHSGANMGFGIGSFHCSSSKQKIVTKSSWEAELVAFSDDMSEVVGTGQFIKELGVKVTIIVHQDNTLTILSTAKGAGSSNRTRHVNIRYFWTRQFIEDGTVTVQYTSTTAMIAPHTWSYLPFHASISFRRRVLATVSVPRSVSLATSRAMLQTCT